MSDFNPIMALMLEQNPFVGRAEQIENEIRPIQSQLAFAPGDYAMLLGANTPLERDTGLLRCLDASEYAETWPDWQERMSGTAQSGWNSYVLCEHFSRLDPEVTVGWFSRLKLMPITPEQYTEVLGWQGDWPEDVPIWMTEVFRDYTEELSSQAPGLVPHPARCPSCRSRNILLRAVRVSTYLAPTGTVVKDGQTVYVPTTEPDEEHEWTAKLDCQDCPAWATLENGEWIMPVE